MGALEVSDAVVRRVVCAALTGIALAAAPAVAQDTVPAPDPAPQAAESAAQSAGTSAPRPDPAPAALQRPVPARHAVRTTAGVAPAQPARSPATAASTRHGRRPARTHRRSGRPAASGRSAASRRAAVSGRPASSRRPASSSRDAVPHRPAVPATASAQRHDDRARRLALAGAALLSLSLASIGLLRLTLRLGG